MIEKRLYTVVVVVVEVETESSLGIITIDDSVSTWTRIFEVTGLSSGPIVSDVYESLLRNVSILNIFTFLSITIPQYAIAIDITILLHIQISYDVHSKNNSFSPTVTGGYPLQYWKFPSMCQQIKKTSILLYIVVASCCHDITSCQHNKFLSPMYRWRILVDSIFRYAWRLENISWHLCLCATWPFFAISTRLYIMFPFLSKRTDLDYNHITEQHNTKQKRINRKNLNNPILGRDWERTVRMHYKSDLPIAPTHLQI